MCCQSAVLDEENAAKIGDQLRMIQMVHSVQYVGIAIACIVLIVVSLASLGLCRAALAVRCCFSTDFVFLAICAFCLIIIIILNVLCTGDRECRYIEVLMIFWTKEVLSQRMISRRWQYILF